MIFVFFRSLLHAIVPKFPSIFVYGSYKIRPKSRNIKKCHSAKIMSEIF